MSIGMRCVRFGYDFIWLGSRGLPPYYITPSGRIVVMEVIEEIPYIRTDSQDCQPRVAKRFIRVPAAPAPGDDVCEDDFHDLPDPTSLEVPGGSPPAAADVEYVDVGRGGGRRRRRWT